MVATIKSVIFLAIPVLSTMIVGRDYTIFQKGLATVDNDIRAWGQAYQNYDGSLQAGLNVMNAGSTLDKDVKHVTDDVQASRPLSHADCAYILSYLNNPIEPDLKSAINALVAKKSQVVSAGLKTSVCRDCSTLATDFDNLFNALIVGCPAQDQSTAVSLKTKFDNDWTSCTSTYGC